MYYILHIMYVKKNYVCRYSFFIYKNTFKVTKYFLVDINLVVDLDFNSGPK